MIKYLSKAKKNPVNQEVMYYPQIAPVDSVQLESVTKAISEKCTVTEHDVKAVLSALQSTIVKHLTDGRTVRLGDLGSFRLTLKGKPQEAEDKVSTKDIDRLRVHYTMSARLAKIFNKGLSDLQFEKVGK